MKFSLFLLVCILPFSVYAQELAPEPASGYKAKPVIEASHYMVVSGHALASKAGEAILQDGGNAIDAGIAVAMTLNLVEPQASGIGGGGFLLYYDKKKGDVKAYDGRETAPEAATSDMFLDKSGKPPAYKDALKGGLSVGTPGLIRMLEQVHKAHGKLPWARLFAPAIALAEHGFPLSPRLYTVIESTPYIRESPEANSLYFTPDGQIKPVGSLIKNPALAKTLRRIAEKGADAFYTGEIADAIVKVTEHNAFRPGRLAQNDLGHYQSIERTPLCNSYHDYKICGMPPPSSGGMTVLQSLKLLERLRLTEHPPRSVETIHRVMEAARLAFADRNAYIADCDYVPVPLAGMLAPEYIAQRSSLINDNHALAAPAAGSLPWEKRCGTLAAATDHPSTTHVSIVDGEGNALSMTNSIEYAFGSGLMVEGFFLNNELTDFSLVPELNGQKVANRIEPGKRPRSSMSPMLVFNKEGKLVLVIGSPGGSRIISYVLQTLISVLDFGMPLDEAINQPHYATTGKEVELEQHTPIEALASPLKQRGHSVIIGDLTSGLHGISISPEKLISGVDARREGEAAGK